MVFSQLKQVQNTVRIEMTFRDMCKGFQKWREQTTTSPSNKHLGIYKSLINAMIYDIKTNYEQQHEHTYLNPHKPTPTAEMALQIQHILLMLAIKHRHTYQGWTIVHNFLLENTRSPITGQTPSHTYK
jgi:hypothetical protein